MRSILRRQPPEGRPGIYISFWAPTEVVAEIDDLADHWGLNRSATIKQALLESHTAVGSRKLRSRRRKRQG